MPNPTNGLMPEDQFDYDHLEFDGWRSIKTAPKDGTTIRVKNGMMQHPVLAKWAMYKSTSPALAFIPAKMQWVLVKDEHEKFMPLPPGTLVIPDQWQPI